MPGRPRGHTEGGGEPESTPSRPHGTHAGGHAGSVRQEEDAVAEVAQAGRAGGRGAGRGGSPGSSTNDRVTARTGTVGGTPDGRPTRIPPAADDEVQLSLELENSGAARLADNGYRVKQNPTPDEVAQARQATGDTGNPRKNPDYLVEGRVFDCYSPTNPSKSVRGIWDAVEDKVVVKKQTQRVVVNLENWRGDLSALRQQLGGWPIEGLKEVKAILPDGDIVQIDLP